MMKKTKKGEQSSWKKNLKKIVNYFIEEERKKHNITIQQLIIPDKTTVLPPSQKSICSNRTYMQMVKGKIFENDLIYINLSQKVNRTYLYEPLYEKCIQELCQAFKEEVTFKKKYSFHYYELRFNALQHTNALYYREVYQLLLACISFIILKKDFDILIFKNIKNYYFLLNEHLQYVIKYTLYFYYYLETHRLEYLKETNQPLLYYLKSHNYRLLYQYKQYAFLILLYIESSLIDQWIKNYYHYLNQLDDWIKGFVYADIAFIYTLQHNRQKALLYFKKAMNIHPLLVKKYIIALFEVSSANPFTLFESYRCLTNTLNDYQDLIAYKKQTNYRLGKRLKEKYISYPCTSFIDYYHHVFFTKKN